MRVLLAAVLVLLLNAGIPALPFAAIGFAASGCGSPRPVTGSAGASPVAPMSEAPLSEPFEIERGSSVVVEGHRLRFDAVREDSRCPEGTNCVQAGRAVAAFSFVGERSVGEMRLEIPGFATAETAPRPEQSLTHGSFRFTLLALDPYPGSAEAGPDARLVATILAERVGG